MCSNTGFVEQEIEARVKSGGWVKDGKLRMRLFDRTISRHKIADLRKK